jgi:23S rRNA-/tRNA-specific pseudouridylate synthase
MGLKRMFLHAWKMSFPHPLNDERIPHLGNTEKKDYGEAV